MEFIELEFPASLFLAESNRNSFYDDVPRYEKIEATGYFQFPLVANEE